MEVLMMRDDCQLQYPCSPSEEIIVAKGPSHYYRAVET